jgi:hypothetical protein
MTAGGWLLLVVSCGTVTSLVAWCFWKVLTLPRPCDDPHAPLDIDIDTGDRDEDR